MTPQQREAMEAAGAEVLESFHLRRSTDLIFDALTAAGFSISLDAVRDHTNCQTCHGSGKWQNPSGLPACSENGILGWVDCPGGSPVVWSTKP